MAGEKKTTKVKKSVEEEKPVAPEESGSEEEKASETAPAPEEAPPEVAAEEAAPETGAEPPVAEGEKPAVEGPKEGEIKKPLEKMTAKELREVALGIPGISGVHAMKKEELLEAITKAWGIKTEKAPRKKKKAKPTATVAELKARIREMKAKRAEAIEKQDKKMAVIYRRRISRLKKRTRRAA
jgi:hypothetical protein